MHPLDATVRLRMISRGWKLIDFKNPRELFQCPVHKMETRNNARVTSAIACRTGTSTQYLLKLSWIFSMYWFATDVGSFGPTKSIDILLNGLTGVSLIIIGSLVFIRTNFCVCRGILGCTVVHLLAWLANSIREPIYRTSLSCLCDRL